MNKFKFKIQIPSPTGLFTILYNIYIVHVGSIHVSVSTTVLIIFFEKKAKIQNIRGVVLDSPP